MSHSREHPTCNERLLHFHESVSHYDRLVELASLSVTGPIDKLDSPKSAKYALRACLLRKYWAPDDELYLNKVIMSAQCILKNQQNESGKDYDKQRKDMKEKFLASYPDKNSVKKHEHSETHQDYATAHELAVQSIYGLLIHGDYQKWLNARAAIHLSFSAISIDVTKLEWFIHEVDSLLNAMVDVRLLTPDFTKMKQNSPTEIKLQI